MLHDACVRQPLHRLSPNPSQIRLRRYRTGRQRFRIGGRGLFRAGIHGRDIARTGIGGDRLALRIGFARSVHGFSFQVKPGQERGPFSRADVTDHRIA